MRGDTTQREERIRERAEKLWMEAGRPAGKDEEFWHQAEREIAIEDHSGKD